jgi:putative DNA primase/helicase
MNTASIEATPTSGPVSNSTSNDDHRDLAKFISQFYEPVKSADFGFSDADNARFFLARYQNAVRYNVSTEKWLYWNGNYWSVYHKNKLELYLAEEAARERERQANAMPVKKDDDGVPDPASLALKKNAMQCAKRSLNYGPLRGCAAIAMANPKLATAQPDWDNFYTNGGLNILGVKNGVIDLDKQEFRKGRRSDMVSKVANVVYDPNAKCPVFDKFFLEILPDPELRHYVQMLFGYALTTKVDAQAIHIFTGNGENGKSKLVELMQNIMGDYGQTTASSLFEEDRNGAMTNDVAALQGCRFGSFSETQDMAKWNEAKLKRLTGDEFLNARFLHHEFFTFRNTCKLIGAINTLPPIKDRTAAFWRRPHVVPFTVSFKGVADDTLPGKMWEERAGVFNWMLEGLRMWHKNGCRLPAPLPQPMIAAGVAWRRESDAFLDFVVEPLDCGKEFSSPQREIKSEFREWLRETGEKRPNVNWASFKNYLITEHKCETKAVGKDHVLTVFGVKLKPSAEDEWTKVGGN